MLREIGPSVGALDRAFRRDIESRSEGEQPMLKIYCDMVVGRIIGEIMALCELELDDEAAA